MASDVQVLRGHVREAFQTGERTVGWTVPGGPVTVKVAPRGAVTIERPGGGDRRELGKVGQAETVDAVRELMRGDAGPVLEMQQESAAPTRRLSSAELGRQARAYRQAEASQEGLGMGPPGFDVPGLEGGGRQEAAIPPAAPDPEPAPEPVVPERPHRPAPPESGAEAAERIKRYLADVTRDRLGRFVKIENLRDCLPGGCNLDAVPANLEDTLDQHDAFLESLEMMLRDPDAPSSEVAEVVEAYRATLDQQHERLLGAAGVDAQALKARAERDPAAYAQGPLHEVVDLASLDGPGRSRLALLLAGWNPGARRPFYKQRPDKQTRVLVPGHWWVDLANPWIQQAGIADEVRDAAREDPDLWHIEGDAGTYEDEGNYFAAQAAARERARMTGEL